MRAAELRCRGAAGKSFFKKKKQPIPVNLATKDWSAQVEKALGATYMFNSGGSCLNIKCALRPCDCMLWLKGTLGGGGEGGG